MSAMSSPKLGDLEATMADEGGTINLEIIPNFRIKRSHKKSRLGCVNCKRRRVKVSNITNGAERCEHVLMPLTV